MTRRKIRRCLIADFKHLAERFDGFQQRHAVLAIPIAILKKYSEDRGNRHVATLTYYGFLSLFPLLLLLLTVLELSMAAYPDFRETVFTSTLRNFPVLADELNRNIQALSGTWFRILFSSVVSLLAAFGVANAIRNTINDLWQIPLVHRRTAPWTYFANIGLILTGGLILVGTTLVTGWVAQSGTLWFHALAATINFGLFLLAYRIATSSRIKTKNLIIQTALTTITWQALQLIGSSLIHSQLDRLNTLYGSFAVVLGLLFWLYLVGRVAVYAIETDAVLTRHFWPRSLTDTGLTAADKRLYAAYARAGQRNEQEKISVTFHNK